MFFATEMIISMYNPIIILFIYLLKYAIDHDKYSLPGVIKHYCTDFSFSHIATGFNCDPIG